MNGERSPLDRAATPPNAAPNGTTPHDTVRYAALIRPSRCAGVACWRMVVLSVIQNPVPNPSNVYIATATNGADVVASPMSAYLQQIGGLNECRQDCLRGVDVQGLARAQQERADIQRPDACDVGDDGDTERTDDREAHDVGADHQPPPIHAVGDGAGE
jgi:hypothetical protein